MQARNKTVSGTLKISGEVISEIAKHTAEEMDGVYSLSAGYADLKELAFKYNAKNPVKVSLNGDVAQIDISVVLKSGYKITDLCEELQRRVKDDVQTMTNVTVAKVNIYVSDIKTEEE